MKLPRIIIPFYPHGDDWATDCQILKDFLNRIKSFLCHSITVFHHPNTSLSLDDYTTIITKPIFQQCDIPFPQRWSAALETVSTNSNIVILDYKNPYITPHKIHCAVSSLSQNNSEAALMVNEAEDHPCQLNYLCNVLQSQIFIPVARMEKKILNRFQKKFNFSSDLLVSIPIPFAWGDWAPQDDDNEFYEALPEMHMARPLDPNHFDIIKKNTVMLWRESDTTARQICIGSYKIAALPLLSPLDATPISIHKSQNNFKILVNGDYVQVYELIDKGQQNPQNKSMLLHKIPESLESSLRVSVQIPAIQNIFILNVYQQSVLPEADVELPYTPIIPLWTYQSPSMERIYNGQKIYGRQAFPEIFEFDGGICVFCKQVTNKTFEEMNCSFAMDNYTKNIVNIEDAPDNYTDKQERLSPPNVTNSHSKTLSKKKTNSLEQSLTYIADEYLNAIGDINIYSMAKFLAKHFQHNENILPLQVYAIHIAKRHHFLTKQDLSKHIQRCYKQIIFDFFGKINDLSQYMTIFKKVITTVHDNNISPLWLFELSKMPHKKNDFTITLEFIDLLNKKFGSNGNQYTETATEKYSQQSNFKKAVALSSKDFQYGKMTIRSKVFFLEALAFSGHTIAANEILSEINSCWQTLSPAIQIRLSRSMALLGRYGNISEIIQTAYKKDYSIKNGFATVGWIKAINPGNNDFQSALDDMEYDLNVGRIAPNYKINYAILQMIILKNVQYSKKIVSEVYSSSNTTFDSYSRIGFYRFLLDKDVNFFRAMIEKDKNLQRISSFGQILNAILLLSENKIAESDKIVMNIYHKQKALIKFLPWIGWQYLKSGNEKTCIKLMRYAYDKNSLQPSWLGSYAIALNSVHDHETAIQVVHMVSDYKLDNDLIKIGFGVLPDAVLTNSQLKNHIYQGLGFADLFNNKVITIQPQPHQHR